MVDVTTPEELGPQHRHALNTARNAVLDAANLVEPMAQTRQWQSEAPEISPGVAALAAQGLLQRWLSLSLALSGGPHAVQGRVLPHTRAELAEFFGDIRDDRGRVVTGYFVEQALNYLTFTEADADGANISLEHLRRVEEVEIALVTGVKELRDVMDGRRGYDEDGTLLP